MKGKQWILGINWLCMIHAWLSISNCTKHHRRTKYVLTYHFSVGQYFFQIYDLWNILDILSVLPSQIKKNPSSKGCTPLNSEELIRRAVYHKCMSSYFSVKQRFEAHSFEGLCKTGTISWPVGPWHPTLSILDTLGPEKVVLIWFQA